MNDTLLLPKKKGPRLNPELLARVRASEEAASKVPPQALPTAEPAPEVSAVANTTPANTPAETSLLSAEPEVQALSSPDAGAATPSQPLAPHEEGPSIQEIVALAATNTDLFAGYFFP